MWDFLRCLCCPWKHRSPSGIITPERQADLTSHAVVTGKREPKVVPHLVIEEDEVIVTVPVNEVKPTKRKKDTIPHKVREAVWITYHGEAEVGICYACGIYITRYGTCDTCHGILDSTGTCQSCGNRMKRRKGGWHCSHVLADVHGGEEIVENLRTCCPHCNLSMGDQNLYVYIKEKNLTGPGAANVERYLQRHASQINSHRTNNWNQPKA